MIAHSDWKHDEVFQGSTEDSKTITMDGDSAHVHGPSPMQAVLMALCSCTSVDVVNILKKKRQDLTALRVTADRAIPPDPGLHEAGADLSRATRSGGHPPLAVDK